MSSIPNAGKNSMRSTILAGIAWNSTFQGFGLVLNFIVMVFTVRLITPAEFGKFAAVTGILAFVNVLNCEAIISHALQLRENQKPDWDMYWSLAVRQQFLLFGLCNLVAGCLWMLPIYKQVAPLLHLASLGLLWDSASRLRANMLRRELDFRRLRVLLSLCSLSSALVTILMAWGGYGAAALVMGGAAAADLAGALVAVCAASAVAARLIRTAPSATVVTRGKANEGFIRQTRRFTRGWLSPASPRPCGR